ncbi:MAG: ABC transporter permease [Lachnospiraceae bacterium]|nr:ABC transporter permease [Lachnospiraceae bacterium]
MWKYVGKRLCSSMVTIFVLVTITFFLIRCMPGNPFQTENLSPQVLQAMEKEYGLDQPIFSQYLVYLRNFLQGDLGISYRKQGVSVTEVIGRALPITLLLGGLSLAVALIFGILLGILQAVSGKKRVHGICTILEGIGTGIPNFVMALLLLLLFGVQWHLFPTVGITSVRHLVLPVISLSIYPMMNIARYTYGEVRTQLQQEYVTFARMKRFPTSYLIYHHVLRNCIPKILHFIGPMAAFLLTGSFVVESIYTIPGLGREFVNAIGNRDYTMIMGLTVFMGSVVILVQFVLDMICVVIDPRVRASLGE